MSFVLWHWVTKLKEIFENKKQNILTNIRGLLYSEPYTKELIVCTGYDVSGPPLCHVALVKQNRTRRGKFLVHQLMIPLDKFSPYGGHFQTWMFLYGIFYVQLCCEKNSLRVNDELTLLLSSLRTQTSNNGFGKRDIPPFNFMTLYVHVDARNTSTNEQKGDDETRALIPK